MISIKHQILYQIKSNSSKSSVLQAHKQVNNQNQDKKTLIFKYSPYPIKLYKHLYKFILFIVDQTFQIDQDYC